MRAFGHRRPCLPDTPKSSQRVPVVRSRDNDGVDALVVEHRPHVRIGGHLLVVLPALRHLGVQNPAVDIAQGHDPHARVLAKLAEVLLPLPADLHVRAHPDHANANVAVGSLRSGERWQSCSGEDSRSGRPLDKRPALCGPHDLSLTLRCPLSFRLFASCILGGTSARSRMHHFC